MCNWSLWYEPTVKPVMIPENGKGYKWVHRVAVTLSKDENLRHIFSYKAPFRGAKLYLEQWYIWDHRYHGDGFTFFLTKEEALKARPNMLEYIDSYDLILIEIEYKKGLVERYECDFAIQARVALAKEIMITGEESWS